MTVSLGRRLNGHAYLIAVSSGSAGVATTFTIALSSSSGAPGAPVSLTATPGAGGWPSGAIVTVANTGLSGSWDRTSVTGSGVMPMVFTFTPSSGAGSTGTLAASASGLVNLTGAKTYAVSSVTPSTTANRYDILTDASSGNTSTAQTVRVIPNGTWKGGSITLTATKTGGGTSSVGTLTLPSGGSAAQTTSWTPPSTGEWKITGSNTASMFNPYGAPFNCFAASSGTAQTLTVGSTNFLDQQPFQQDCWSGTPAGWTAINGASFGMGWGEFWAQITPGGNSAGVFARLIDADSSGATSTSGGTLISGVAQVYGAVASGSQVTIRLLIPASDYTCYLELATDSAFTNPARIPLRFRVTDVVAIMSRSMECGWMQCYPYPGPPGNTNYSTYTKTMVCGGQNPGGNAMPAWQRADAVNTYGYFGATFGSVGSMEAGRMWLQRKGHGCALVGCVPAGFNADDFVAADGSPPYGFGDAVSKCNGKFRYLKTLLNGWSGNYTAESYSEYQTLYGNFVAKMPTVFPSLAVMAIGVSSGQFGGDGSSTIGYVRVNKIITDQIEPVNPMVISADAGPDWHEWTSGHATWPSQLRYVRNGVRALLMADGTHAGGYGLALADRYATFSSTGTLSGNNLYVPFTLPAGASTLVAKGWGNGQSNSTFNYSTPSANALRCLITVYAGSGNAATAGTKFIRLTGITIDNANKRLVLALDRSAGAGTVTYGDATSGAQPNTFNVQVFADFARDYDDQNNSVGIFDDRVLDDCGYGSHARPKLDVMVS